MRSFPRLLAGLMLVAISAIPAAPAMADPPPWAPAHGYRAKQYRYVYYPAYQVYYAPETRVWFWFGGGQWRTGVSLPTGLVLGGDPGVSLVLDTGRPYERHDYIVQQYGGEPWEGHGKHHKHK